MTEIRPLDPTDDVAFAAWHRVYERAEEYQSGAAFSTHWGLRSMQIRLSEPDSALRRNCVSAVVDGEVVACGSITMSLLDNLRTADLAVYADPAHARRGYGTAVLQALEQVAADEGRPVLQATASWGAAGGVTGEGVPAAGFARRHGYALALGELQSQLDLPLPAGLLDMLEAEAAPHHSAYTIESWTGPVPDGLAPGWLALDNSLITEAPSGDLEVEDQARDVAVLREEEARTKALGRRSCHAVALDADGEVVALTELQLNDAEPARVWQWATMVRRADRGHRLGLAVKVAALRLLLDTGIAGAERITTFNAASNTHMLEVNARFGFRVVARMAVFQKTLAGRPPPR